MYVWGPRSTLSSIADLRPPRPISARLPFSRTRRIFNQFNAGREVKISRDGTELFVSPALLLSPSPAIANADLASPSSLANPRREKL